MIWLLLQSSFYVLKYTKLFIVYTLGVNAPDTIIQWLYKSQLGLQKLPKPKFNFLMSLLVLFCCFMTWRSTLPRFRIDQLLNFFWEYTVFLSFLFFLFLCVFVF